MICSYFKTIWFSKLFSRYENLNTRTLRNQKHFIFIFSKELLSFRKLKKAHVEAADNTAQIRINKIKSESSVTTKTFINEQMFVETEFLPRRLKSFQVNMLTYELQGM